MLVELFPLLLYGYIAWRNGGRWGTRTPGLRMQKLCRRNMHYRDA